MIEFTRSLVRAGIREHKKKITIVMLCALAAELTVLGAEAESSNGTSQTGTPSEQLLAARSKQRAGEYIAARHILQEALSKSPNSASLLNQLGSVQQDLGEYLEAERSYMLALSDSSQTEGERLLILNNLGTLYLETGQYREGRANPRTAREVRFRDTQRQSRGGGCPTEYNWQPCPRAESRR